MPAHKASPLGLSPEHQQELNALVRAHSTPQKLAERSRIILLASAGQGVSETAGQLGDDGDGRPPASSSAMGQAGTSGARA